MLYVPEGNVNRKPSTMSVPVGGSATAEAASAIATSAIVSLSMYIVSVRCGGSGDRDRMCEAR